MFAWALVFTIECALTHGVSFDEGNINVDWIVNQDFRRNPFSGICKSELGSTTHLWVYGSAFDFELEGC